MAIASQAFKGFSWACDQEDPGFASLGSAQDWHHNDKHVFPTLSTWLAIESGCGLISLHTAKNNYIRQFAKTIFG